MPETYKYRPLSGLRCIRVLELAPALRKDTPFRGRLFEVDLPLDCPAPLSYDALSYVWGYTKGDIPIICEGRVILITKNCDAALRQLRSKACKIRIWIDAICINQENFLERNDQVRLMEEIYRNAEHVRIWLSEPAAGTRQLIGFGIGLKMILHIFRLTFDKSQYTKFTGELISALIRLSLRSGTMIPKSFRYWKSDILIRRSFWAKRYPSR